jgi:ABC-type amino acid transport substrate-binding protein
VLLLVATACLPSPARADLPELISQGVLRVVVAADEGAETFALQPSESPGFERELMEGFAKLHGLRLQVVVAKGYADRIPILVKGDGDVIAAIFDTEDRRRLVDFTVEILPTHNVAVTAAPKPVAKRVEDLRTLRVGVIRGAKPAEEALEAGVPASALRKYETRDELIHALQTDTVDVCVLPVSEFAIAAKRVPALVAGTIVGPRGRLSWAVRKQDPQLRAAFDEYIGHVRRSPSWSRLVVKYFGQQALSVLGRTKE